MHAVPIKQKEAFDFIDALHRHHKRPTGWLFGIGALNSSGKLVGVCVVGRPSARHADDGMTVEITRLCTDGSRNACSFLYGAAWRAARAIGYTRACTFILPEEGGASLRGSGWIKRGATRGETWSRGSRLRDDKHPIGPKERWCVGAWAEDFLPREGGV
ncbi:MAG: XF1762 family protein [Gluconobacter japonicus]|uniref:XF1762 family protein n=1 Tax=Gluconobacter japonicus TaxID=376620 RepID=UPI0039EA3F0D